MIIAISGKAQAGKDTATQMIIYTIWYYKHYLKSEEVIKDEYCYKHYLLNNNYTIMKQQIGYTHKSFAHYLKKCLATIVGYDYKMFEWQEFKKSQSPIKVNGTFITMRELLQKFGTAIRKEVCDDFWVQLLLNDYKPEHFENWIISDVRFKSEIEGVKRFNNITLRINKSDAGAGNHISEIELDNYNFDYTIENNGSLEDLLFKVREFCLINKII